MSFLWTKRGWLVPLSLLTAVVLATPFFMVLPHLETRGWRLLVIHIGAALFFTAPIWTHLFTKWFSQPNEDNRFLTLPNRFWVKCFTILDLVIIVIILIAHFFF